MEKSSLEELVPDRELPVKADVEQEALSRLAKELKERDLYFGAERWEFGEIFSDGRILIRRPDASPGEPAERILTAEEFKASIEVVPRTLSALAKELRDKDLLFDGKAWEFVEVYSDGKIRIRRPGASQDEPQDTRERILTPEEFKESIEVIPRTP